MQVAIGRASLKSHIHAAVGITVRIGGGPAGTVQQDDEPVGVAQVSVKVAVEFAGDFKPHLQ